jgi:hypothetical protein
MSSDRRLLDVAERLPPLRFVTAGRTDDHLEEKIAKLVTVWIWAMRGYCWWQRSGSTPEATGRSARELG